MGGGGGVDSMSRCCVFFWIQVGLKGYLLVQDEDGLFRKGFKEGCISKRNTYPFKDFWSEIYRVGIVV
jgi:hypothetical protein